MQEFDIYNEYNKDNKEIHHCVKNYNQNLSFMEIKLAYTWIKKPFIQYLSYNLIFINFFTKYFETCHVMLKYHI